MNFSKKGAETLKQLEGFRDKPYKDKAGHLTIGYGHKVKKGEVFSFISKEAAEKLMFDDVKPFETFLNTHLKVNLTQNQFDALIIFIYNIGDGAFLKSDVFRNLKDRKFEDATKPWSKWINVSEYVANPTTGHMEKILVPVDGLIKRRAVEITMFST